MRVLLAAVLAIGLAGAARAQCPTNLIVVVHDQPNTVVLHSSAPRDSLSGTATGAYGYGHYDLVAGEADADGISYAPPSVGYASVQTSDVYTLIGPPLAPPITFTAQGHLAVDYVCPGGYAYGAIQEGASNLASASWNLECSQHVVDLRIAITRAVGTTFGLSLLLNAQGHNGGRATMSESLSFPDLPPGYAITSCQGFSTVRAVPVRSRSWGTLKTHYR